MSSPCICGYLKEDCHCSPLPREVQLTPEERETEEQWKREHTDCQCWKCMFVKMPWVEKLDQAQRRIEELENQLSEQNRRPSTQLGQ